MRKAAVDCFDWRTCVRLPTAPVLAPRAKRRLVDRNFLNRGHKLFSQRRAAMGLGGGQSESRVGFAICLVCLANF